MHLLPRYPFSSRFSLHLILIRPLFYFILNASGLYSDTGMFDEIKKIEGELRQKIADKFKSFYLCA